MAKRNCEYSHTAAGAIQCLDDLTSSLTLPAYPSPSSRVIAKSCALFKIAAIGTIATISLLAFMSLAVCLELTVNLSSRPQHNLTTKSCIILFCRIE
jgi:hypothetical protein